MKTFNELRLINVNEHTEKKGQLTQLEAKSSNTLLLVHITQESVGATCVQTRLTNTVNNTERTNQKAEVSRKVIFQDILVVNGGEPLGTKPQKSQVLVGIQERTTFGTPMPLNYYRWVSTCMRLKNVWVISQSQLRSGTYTVSVTSSRKQGNLWTSICWEKGEKL